MSLDNSPPRVWQRVEEFVDLRDPVLLPIG
jgi:hypothetical protein